MSNIDLIKTWKTKNGHNAFILSIGGGHLCGYLEIEKESPLFGLTYNDPVPNIKKDDMKNQEFGKRGPIPILLYSMSDDESVSLEVYFDVHGSLTYGESSLLDMDNSWFLGFDCNHFDDRENPKDVVFVEQECENLSQQIKGYEGASQ